MCPAEACDIGERPHFAVTNSVPTELIAAYEAFLRDNEIAVAGIEFANTTDGRVLTYDINTNTNYNPAAELTAGVTPGPARLAEAIKERLSQRTSMRTAAE